MAPNTVRFDMFAWQVVPWPVMRDDVRYLETLDIGTVWLGDTYVMPPAFGGAVLEAWTTLAALADCTQRVRLGTMVSDVPLRHPAMLAKQAATVDCISGGRLDLGIGAGDNFAEERSALGLPDLTPDARVARLREAVEVIDRLLRDQQVTYHGAYYHLDQAPLVPAPVQRPRPPLIIAAHGRKALRLVAEHADVWVDGPDGETSDGALPNEKALQSVRERNRRLDEYCGAIGRDPGTVERACLAGWSGREAAFASPDAFLDYVGRYRDAGVQRFIFSFGSAAAPAPYSSWVRAGAWVSREVLESFAAQAMTDIRSSA